MYNNLNEYCDKYKINDSGRKDLIEIFINFWSNNYLSNFYKCNFKDTNNNKFNCSEQYFMFYKCLTFDSNNKILLTNILNENDPKKIKQFGRLVPNFNQEIWNTKKYNIMVDSLSYKFNQNENLKNKLIKTNNKYLYEASPYDKIWGIGYNKKTAIKTDISKYGLNLLGKALMEIRNNLTNNN